MNLAAVITDTLRTLGIDAIQNGALMLMLALAVADLVSFFWRQVAHFDAKGSILSIGVLGTFAGIFLGLLDFDTRQIEASVPALLEGLKLAFLTSIVGMALAVLLGVVESLLGRVTGRHPPGMRTDELLGEIATRVQGLANQIEAETGESAQHRQRMEKLLGQQLHLEHDQLNALQEQLSQIVSVLRQLQDPQRFTKLDDTGRDLPSNATRWSAIRDHHTGLVWLSGSDGASPCTWSDAAKSVRSAGRLEFRLPTADQLRTLDDRAAQEGGLFFHGACEQHTWCHVDRPGSVVSLQTGLEQPLAENGEAHRLLVHQPS